jgi:tetratricopeptide (TPR) repeat protein
VERLPLPEEHRNLQRISSVERNATRGQGARYGFVGKSDAPQPRFVTDFAPDVIDLSIQNLGDLGKTIQAAIENEQYEHAVTTIRHEIDRLVSEIRRSSFFSEAYERMEQQLSGLGYLLAEVILSLPESHPLLKTIAQQLRRWRQRGMDEWSDAFLACALALSPYDSLLDREMEEDLGFSPAALRAEFLNPENEGDDFLAALYEDIDPDDVNFDMAGYPLGLDIIYDIIDIQLRLLERRGRVSDYLQLAGQGKQYHRYAIMLALQGDFARAIETARQQFKDVFQWSKFVQALDALGQTEVALELAHEVVRKPASQWRTDELDVLDSMRASLAEWLATRAAALGKDAIALEAILVAIEDNPTLTRYQLLQRLAGEQWTQLRSQILRRLQRSGEAEDVAEIYLYEGRYAEALKVLCEDDALTPDHAMRIVDHLPEKVRAECLKRAEEIIRKAILQLYPLAAEWLAVVKRSYQVQGKQQEWDTLIQTLIKQNKRKPILSPLLQRLAEEA